MRHWQLSFALVCLTSFAACGGQDAGLIDTACRSNDDCDASELCATNLCTDGFGECVARPETCEDVPVLQVCGCDGQTYENDCLAQQAGIRLQQTGPCFCGDNSECVEGQFCALDDSCLDPGTCQPEPEMCEPDPQTVCGCDGQTYDNACRAFQAGSRVSSLGMCDCDTNSDCGSQDYCDASTCDGPGGCVARPSMCPPDEEPVTGCDGIIYSNACEAAAAGVRVRPS